jgi:hypothetical protein
MRSKSADMSLKSFAKIMGVGQGKRFCELSRLISSGNKKLPKTTAIFNMGPAHGCPSLRLGLCKAFTKDGRHVCYAMKAETPMYPDVLPRRVKQLKYWMKCSAEEFVWQFLFINALKERPWKSLRFNESGDFHSQECIVKANKIAMMLKRYGIRVYCYTHRSDLSYIDCKHLVVNGSNFKKKGVPNVFLMVEDVKKDRPKGYMVCGGDCRVCDRCSIRGSKIVIKRH